MPYAHRLAVAAAHEIAARIVAQLDPSQIVPTDAAALLDCAGVRVVVRIEAIGASTSEPAGNAAPLREVEAAALEAAPAANHAPVTIKTLARVAGYAYNGYFRGAVGSLISKGLLVRIPGGIRKAS